MNVHNLRVNVAYAEPPSNASMKAGYYVALTWGKETAKTPSTYVPAGGVMQNTLAASSPHLAGAPPSALKWNVSLHLMILAPPTSATAAVPLPPLHITLYEKGTLKDSVRGSGDYSMLSNLKKGMEVGHRISLRPNGYIMLYLTALDFGHTPDKEEKMNALRENINRMEATMETKVDSIQAMAGVKREGLTNQLLGQSKRDYDHQMHQIMMQQEANRAAGIQAKPLAPRTFYQQGSSQQSELFGSSQPDSPHQLQLQHHLHPLHQQHQQHQQQQQQQFNQQQPYPQHQQLQQHPQQQQQSSVPFTAIYASQSSSPYQQPQTYQQPQLQQSQQPYPQSLSPRYQEQQQQLYRQQQQPQAYQQQQQAYQQSPYHQPLYSEPAQHYQPPQQPLQYEPVYAQQQQQPQAYPQSLSPLYREQQQQPYQLSIQPISQQQQHHQQQMAGGYSQGYPMFTPL
eukprot:TRINITY_DN2309_c0_g1_i2.p1 TRINITY_DN2309_c0_g1~~TRINITY_DN2309_c0_g1_i2.p1  ORF type:complete len:454 (-),score=142.27 TRINITY_DN2309_c0_g1_i2:168-1529(-)